MKKAGMFLLLAAAIWSVGAGLWIALTPQTIYELEAAGSNNGTQVAVESARQVSWFQVQGWWGIFILVVFAGLYCCTVFLFWRSRALAGTITGIISLAATFLAGFSIGPVYLPAAVMLLASMVLQFWMRFESDGAG